MNSFAQFSPDNTACAYCIVLLEKVNTMNQAKRVPYIPVLRERIHLHQSHNKSNA